MDKKEYIERGALLEMCKRQIECEWNTLASPGTWAHAFEDFSDLVEQTPAADVVSKGVYDQVKWERDMAMQQLEERGIPFCGKADDVVEVEKVAEMLRAMFDDDCACNYNGNDEWLPYVCEYGYTECPDAPEDNGCWKQFVKHFLAKTGGEREEQTNEC